MSVILFVGLLALGISPFLLLSLLASATANGVEFNPHNFRRRSYHYFEIPIIRYMVSPITRSDGTGNLEKYINRKKYIAQHSSRSRWDLVSGGHAKTNSPQCDALILCLYLDMTDENGEQMWLIWSQDHPELAEVLWPEVAKLARQHAYYLIPPLFRLAQDAKDAETLNNRIHDLLNRKYRKLADAQRQLGNNKQAITFYTNALATDPSDIKSLRSRATSWQALGDNQKASSDLLKAQRTQRIGEARSTDETAQ